MASFYQWRAFCTTHERMKLRKYVLVRGYPPMDLNAFARTFWMPSLAVNKPVAWINRCAHTQFGLGVNISREADTTPSDSHPTTTTVIPLHNNIKCMKHGDLYLPTEHRDDYTLAMMSPTIDVVGISTKLSLYFVHESLVQTDEQQARLHHAPVFHKHTDMRLLRGPHFSDIVHVCFLAAEDTKIIAKYLMFERAHNALLPQHMHRVTDEETMRPQNQPLPIDELFLIVDKEPNAAFRTKVEALHTPDMPDDMRCVYDVWAQSSLWVNPLTPQMVDRMEIASHFPPSVQRLLDCGESELALQKAHTYIKMDANDIPTRFIGARPGNFVLTWKTATVNSAPKLHIVVRNTK